MGENGARRWYDCILWTLQGCKCWIYKWQGGNVCYVIQSSVMFERRLFIGPLETIIFFENSPGSQKKFTGDFADIVKFSIRSKIIYIFTGDSPRWVNLREGGWFSSFSSVMGSKLPVFPVFGGPKLTVFLFLGYVEACFFGSKRPVCLWGPCMNPGIIPYYNYQRRCHFSIPCTPRGVAASRCVKTPLLTSLSRWSYHDHSGNHSLSMWWRCSADHVVATSPSHE